MNKNKNAEGLSKFLYHYLPIIVFFVCYKLSVVYDKLLFATLAMLFTTFIAIFTSYILTRKIPKVATFSACILGFFCGLTIFFDDEYFIKIKPTIINLIFAGILFYGNFVQKPMLKYLPQAMAMPSHPDYLLASLEKLIKIPFMFRELKTSIVSISLQLLIINSRLNNQFNLFSSYFSCKKI